MNAFVLIVCSYLFWETFQFNTNFNAQGLGPAFFPRATLLCIAFLNIVEIVSAFKSKQPQEQHSIMSKQLLLFITAILCFVGLFNSLPFLLVAIVTLFLMSLILKLKLVSSLVFSVTISLAVYLIFTQGFNIIL
ncbi:tripartite tricarboxylate transporter TctB family protein [Salibacterium qingdaonense]|nr:tripartite tricarboxylate transporter TctB family protein [Salibacterium qingdaonense]